MAASDETPSDMFHRALHVERSIAESLEAEGFTSIEEVAHVPFAELAAVPGLTEAAATQLRNIARLYLLNLG